MAAPERLKYRSNCHPRGGAHGHVVLAPLAAEGNPGQPVLIRNGQGGRRVDEAIRQLVQGGDAPTGQGMIVLPGGADIGTDPVGSRRYRGRSWPRRQPVRAAKTVSQEGA